MSFELNPDQKIACAGLYDFLRDDRSEGKHFTLTGFPGTGKTFSLSTVLKDLPHLRGSVVGGTVAHSAKNVLQDSIPTVPCFTFAQLYGMKMTVDNENEGALVCRPDKYMPKRIKGAKVAILDEVSMADDAMYDMIMTDAKSRGIKVIAVGDPDQLPAVGQEHDSKFFDKIDASLTIPMRFSGPIGDIASLYRTEINHIRQDVKFNKWALNEYTQRIDNYDLTNNTGYKFMNDLDTMIASAAHDIKSNPDNKNHTRVLAYTNDAVDYINKEIRTHIYNKKKPLQFEANEVIISEGGYAYNGKPELFNGQILQVDKTVVCEGPFGVPCLMLSFKNRVTNGSPIYVVQRNRIAQRKYKEVKERFYNNAVRDKRQWKSHRGFIDSFAYFKYGYATSLYKCQGMTLENVYVCEGEVMDIRPISWQQKFQALYVAMTRAKKELYIYNKGY